LAFDQILGLLTATPNTGVEKPALQHFGLQALASTYLPAHHGSADPAPSGPAALGVLRSLPAGVIAGVLAASVLIAVGLVVCGPRIVPRRARRAPELAAIPFAAMAVLSVLMLVPKSAALATSAADSTAPAVAIHEALPVQHHMPSTGAVLWQRLSAIEATVAQLETKVQVLSTLATQTSHDELSLQPRNRQATPAADPAVEAQHAAAQLEAALHDEYAFYVATIQSPDAQQALVAAAQTAPDTVRTVVAYNVQAVQAQLAQEAAITAAQNALPSRNGPAPTALAVPMSGAISQAFGPSDLAMEPPLTFQGVTYPHFHTGVDIAAPLDSPVAAAADGLVVIAGSSTDTHGRLVGYGNYVVIAHAGRMVTLYGHLDKLLVHAGQAVRAGDVIGLEGSTGYSTGPHLHFEVRIAGLLTDPMSYLANRLH
jgi:murein DD-endopeptidase MepM/ murein hydrolase activator NlpD